MGNWNQGIIEEYRNNAGQLSGYFAGRTHLLLHHVGAKSGQERVNPIAYSKDGDRLIIGATKMGEPTNPDWFYNVKANPEVTVEIGAETFSAHATPVIEEPERSRLYARLVADHPGFAAYETKTTRKIPVILLDLKK